MNDLFRIFTKANVKVLQLLSRKSLYLRAAAEELGLSPAAVYKALKLFKKLDFVTERREKNRRYFVLNKESVILQKIKAVLNLHSLLSERTFRDLTHHGVIGVYGSFASGQDELASDIDIWIYVEREKERTLLRQRVRKLETKLGRIVNVLVLNKEKLKSIKVNDPEFYLRLKLTSVCIGGYIFD